MGRNLGVINGDLMVRRNVCLEHWEYLGLFCDFWWPSFFA
ncbi:hypothetical protein BHW_0900085 [Borrelia hermsii MTW]|nr:hypothetical protein BHW_0900085 [Borrelia hermsii MTW]